MLVAKYYYRDEVRVEEVSRPEIGPEEILVKVFASGICGSDLMEWRWRGKTPLVLGHEVTGKIAKTGEKVEKYKVGERVFVSRYVPCNTCDFCLKGEPTTCATFQQSDYFPGGLAEYIKVPALNVDRGVFLLPPEISFEEGVFIEPLACAIRAQRKVGFISGGSVLILGCGVAGLLHLLLASISGASRIIATDIWPSRLEKALDLGAAAVIYGQADLPRRVQEENNYRPIDLVIICTSALPAFSQAFECVAPGGTVLCFAPPGPKTTLQFPLYHLWQKNVKIIASSGYSPSEILPAIELLQTKKIPVQQIISHRLPLEKTAMGFQLVAEAKKCLKVIIKPNKD
jgi:L-iditol 2-dehydrogenase